jgi:hypothetical protein
MRVEWFGMRPSRWKSAQAVAGNRYVQVGHIQPLLTLPLAICSSRLVAPLCAFRGMLDLATEMDTLSAGERAALEDLIRAIATLLNASTNP